MNRATARFGGWLGPWLAVAAFVAGATGCATLRQAPPPTAAARPVDQSMARGIAIADSLVTAALDTLVPGAVLVVKRDGVLLHERAFGHARLHDSSGRALARPLPMRTTTVFDLASVTKVAATTFAVMLLADRGLVDVDAPLRRYLPDFRGPRLDSITVRHLLTHTAGLVQWQPLYYQASTAAGSYRAIRQMPLEWGVGEGRHYSDLGFMLLGYMVERVAGEPLDRFVERELYRPLGLRSTTFLPLSHGLRDFAATEMGNGYERRMVHDSTFGYRYPGDPTSWDGWRQYLLVGEVDDGNAWYANGGVAGHAGLFSTAAEVATLVDVLVAKGEHDGRRIVSSATVRRFLTRDGYGNFLGWMSPEGLPDGSFAHNGFTGTYAVGVPSLGLTVVLLTNRQELGTDNRGYFPNLATLQSGVARALVDGARGASGGSGGDQPTHDFHEYLR